MEPLRLKVKCGGCRRLLSLNPPRLSQFSVVPVLFFLPSLFIWNDFFFRIPWCEILVGASYVESNMITGLKIDTILEAC